MAIAASTDVSTHAPMAEGLSTSLLSEPQQLQLRAIIEKGLPHVSRPYLALAEQIKATEQAVMDQINFWQNSGLIKRFGLVVKHRQLGYKANAMVVWNIPDEHVEKIANQLSMYSEVSLCYRRPRRLPDWPYNLFCMIHGTERDIVLAQINKITEELNLASIEKDVLFSYKAYKQMGARYGKKGAAHVAST